MLWGDCVLNFLYCVYNANNVNIALLQGKKTDAYFQNNTFMNTIMPTETRVAKNK